MAIRGLKSYIDGDFINKLGAIARGEDSAKANLQKALRGGSDPVQSAAEGLRLGARTYATAVQGINLAASVVNLAQADLEKIDKLADQMIEVATKATRSSASQQKRRNLNFEFRSLAKEMETIVNSASLGQFDYLEVSGLEEVFVTIGLDPKRSDSTADIFNSFTTVDGHQLLASEKIRGRRPVPVPAGIPGNKHVSEAGNADLFSAKRTILRQADAFAAVEDLSALKNQIKNNTEVLERARGLLQDNLVLVRETGLALLDMSDQLTTEKDANDLARELRKRIRREAGTAVLAQAENLEPLAVATLTLKPEDFN
ncbi:MAG: hypothetical protein D6719_07950 [Candidatus Dadabacteria bacterium]|nr:MAG: hypothetical protein D6719_07950 [Candidatus Dadabacteria bacterium]